jgi:hypothetical protein
MQEQLRTGKDYLALGPEVGRVKYVADMLARLDPNDPYTTEENEELFNLQFDTFIEIALVGLQQLSLVDFSEKQEAKNKRVAEIRAQMLSRRKKETEQTFETLMNELAVLNSREKTKAREIGKKIAQMLLKTAKGTSRGFLEAEVNEFIFLMFNRFRIKNYDEFHHEIWAIQQNPVVLKEPEDLEQF